MTAFDTKAIENAGIERPADFIALTPNVNLVETQNAGNAFVVIRGISQNRNSEPSVAVIVDGVQQVNPAQFNQDLFDIAQIEVLKGPQGGLYGRNAIGGAIIITTKAPTTNSPAMSPQASTTASAISCAAGSAGRWPRTSSSASPAPITTPTVSSPTPSSGKMPIRSRTSACAATC